MYEERLASYLQAKFGKGRVLHGQWFKFKDDKGEGVCQPDVVILPDGQRGPLVIVECKLSHKPRAEGKLRNLYAPVVQCLYPKQKKIVLVQACKRLSRRFKGDIIESIDDVFQPKFNKKYVVLNIRHLAEV